MRITILCDFDQSGDFREKMLRSIHGINLLFFGENIFFNQNICIARFFRRCSDCNPPPATASASGSAGSFEAGTDLTKLVFGRKVFGQILASNFGQLSTKNNI
jgi:hypothetical protein